jgi:hypothetical protein
MASEIVVSKVRTGISDCPCQNGGIGQATLLKGPIWINEIEFSDLPTRVIFQ